MSVSCDGRADVYEELHRKARKPHRCDACHLTIQPGHRYTRETMLFDGRWDHTTRCARCQLIFEHLVTKCRADTWNEEWPDPSLNCGHEYSERWECEPPEWLAALAFWLPGDPLPCLESCTPRSFTNGCRVGWELRASCVYPAWRGCQSRCVVACS